MITLAITTEGNIETVLVPRKELVQGKDNQQEGDLLAISMGDSLTMWVSTKGANREQNELATALYENRHISSGRYVRGNVYFTGGTNKRGKAKQLTSRMSAEIELEVSLAKLYIAVNSFYDLNSQPRVGA